MHLSTHIGFLAISLVLGLTTASHTVTPRDHRTNDIRSQTLWADPNSVDRSAQYKSNEAIYIPGTLASLQPRYRIGNSPHNNESRRQKRTLNWKTPPFACPNVSEKHGKRADAELSNQISLRVPVPKSDDELLTVCVLKLAALVKCRDDARALEAKAKKSGNRRQEEAANFDGELAHDRIKDGVKIIAAYKWSKHILAADQGRELGNALHRLGLPAELQFEVIQYLEEDMHDLKKWIL